MRKTISAKFTSRCSACGSTINPGETITYDPAVKYSSRHETCPSTRVNSKVPLNSPGRAALQGRGKGDVFIGEKSEIVRCFAADSKADQSDLGQTILATKGAEVGQYLTVIGVASHYVSQDEADDFDLVGPSGDFERHYSVTKYYRVATNEEAEACKQRIAVKESKARFEKLCSYGTDYPWGEAGRQIISSDEANKLGERTRIWAKTVGYSVHEGWRVESGLLTHHPVYDDAPYWQIIRFSVMKPEDAELVRNAQEVK